MDRNRPKFTDYTNLDYKQYSWTKNQQKVSIFVGVKN